jgi:hypothetical protein
MGSGGVSNSSGGKSSGTGSGAGGGDSGGKVTAGGASGGVSRSGGGGATGGTTSAGGGTSSAGTQPLAACAVFTKGGVTFSVPSGTFQGTLQVSLSSSAADAEIRYTSDGKAPTSTSTLYAGSAIALTGTTRLRAQSFVNGVASGTASTALYVARAVEATHDLPVIILDSYGSGKLPTAEAQRVFVDVAYLAMDPGAGGTVTLAQTPTVASFAAFHVRGNSSAMFDKVPYRLELRNEAGDDRDCPVLGMPSESDWALVGPHADKTLVHNSFVYELAREMGMAAPRVKLAEVYVNTDKQPLAADDYQGVYQIVETIKNQKNRLDLKQLDESKTSATEITGGYIFSFEWMITSENPLPCPSGTTKPWKYMELVDPEPAAAAQKDWLTQHLVAFHNALRGSNITDATSGYPAYIEPKTWIDQIILNEFTRNMDGYVRSQYFYKDRGAKINAGPVWDFDLIAGTGIKTTAMANISTEGWGYEANASRMDPTSGGTPGSSSGTSDWFPILLKDATFTSQLVARWKVLRGTLLSDAAVASRIDDLTKNLGPAADRNFKKWNILTKAQVAPFDTPTEATWTAQVTYMKTWLQKRAAWLDTQWK